MTKIVATLLLAFTAPTFALDKPSNEMNGIRFKKFENFEKTWSQVTVRFRKDTDELRFTYANPLAAKTMRAGKTDFPDGAVLAKVGVITKDDPAFASSKVPSGSVRYQFMVRDRKKYSSTDGWGYALFDANGMTFPQETGPVTRACVACHHLVPQRNYVFSEWMTLRPQKLPDDDKKAGALDLTQIRRIDFVDAQTSTLPASLQFRLKTVKQVRRLTGELAEHIFIGTLHEVLPSLEAESQRKGYPAIISDKEGRVFAIVGEPRQLAETATLSCAKDSVELVSLTVDGNSPPVKKNFCYAREP